MGNRKQKSSCIRKILVLNIFKKEESNVTHKKYKFLNFHSVSPTDFSNDFLTKALIVINWTSPIKGQCDPNHINMNLTNSVMCIILFSSVLGIIILFGSVGRGKREAKPGQTARINCTSLITSECYVRSSPIMTSQSYFPLSNDIYLINLLTVGFFSLYHHPNQNLKKKKLI